MTSLPYLSLLLAFGLIYFPRLFSAMGQMKHPDGWDNKYPRAQQATLSGLAARAQGAHMNGFEAFAPFAVGILACQAAGANPLVTGYLGMAFVGIRTAYVMLYLANLDRVRSLTWLAGFGVVSALLVRPLLV